MLEIGKRHHFIDGNKRIVYLIMKIFLINYGFHFKVDYQQSSKFIISIINFNSDISFDEITEWIFKSSIKVYRINIEKYIKEALLGI